MKQRKKVDAALPEPRQVGMAAGGPPQRGPPPQQRVGMQVGDEQAAVQGKVLGRRRGKVHHRHGVGPVVLEFGIAGGHGASLEQGEQCEVREKEQACGEPGRTSASARQHSRQGGRTNILLGKI
jgi:hypothetical protein